MSRNRATVKIFAKQKATGEQWVAVVVSQYDLMGNAIAYPWQYGFMKFLPVA